jgi:hypothetical protein
MELSGAANRDRAAVGALARTHPAPDGRADRAASVSPDVQPCDECVHLLLVAQLSRHPGLGQLIARTIARGQWELKVRSP